MKKLCLAAIAMMLTINALSQRSEIGIGIILGSQAGITAKMWTSETAAIDASLSYDFAYLDNLFLNASYLFHNWSADANEDIIKLYFGPGAGLGFTSEISISVRVPAGASYFFNTLPLEAFVELAPALQLTGPGGIRFLIGGYLGARWYF